MLGTLHRLPREFQLAITDQIAGFPDLTSAPPPEVDERLTGTRSCKRRYPSPRRSPVADPPGVSAERVHRKQPAQIVLGSTSYYTVATAVSRSLTMAACSCRCRRIVAAVPIKPRPVDR